MAWVKCELFSRRNGIIFDMTLEDILTLPRKYPSNDIELVRIISGVLDGTTLQMILHSLTSCTALSGLVIRSTYFLSDTRESIFRRVMILLRNRPTIAAFSIQHCRYMGGNHRPSMPQVCHFLKHTKLRRLFIHSLFTVKVERLGEVNELIRRSCLRDFDFYVISKEGSNLGLVDELNLLKQQLSDWKFGLILLFVARGKSRLGIPDRALSLAVHYLLTLE